MNYREAFSITCLCLSLVACPKQEEGEDDAVSSEGNDNATSEGTTTATSDGTTTASTEGTTTASTEGTTTSTEGTTSSTEGETTSGADMGTPLHWYSTCGDPVCSGYDGPWDGVPACSGVVEGDPCTNEGETCDFMSDCNALMICAAEDPKLQPGGCPISRAAFKQDIRYLDASERDGFYRELLDIRMATWRYRDRHDAKSHLGVILEDGEDQIWADPNNDRVDLYSYGSLAIVGVQEQAGEIAELKAALAALQVQVEDLRERAERCE